MIDSHISDKAFKDALEVALKAQGLNKKERQETTNIYIEKYPTEHRNDILDDEEQKARELEEIRAAIQILKDKAIIPYDFNYKTHYLIAIDEE
jgi:hypothetical protein